MVHSKEYAYAGYDKKEQKHIFFHKNRKCRYSLQGRFKYVDNEKGIVYFFNRENISYAYSAEKKYDKTFLNDELNKILERRDILDKLYPNQKFIWKAFDFFKNYYNKELTISSIYDNIVYFMFTDGKTDYLSKDEFLRYTLVKEY